MEAFKRDILDSDTKHQVVPKLQECLLNLIDLALQLKQAHWNVVGANFRSVHLQLDEIIETVRAGSDEVAERIVTLGVAADGRAAVVSSGSHLTQYPEGLHQVTETVTAVADRMATTIAELRKAITPLGDLDPISEDMLIGLSAALEKHLWMLQAQEIR